MKQLSIQALPFNAYPLTIVEKKAELSILAKIKNEKNEPTTSIQKNKTSNDHNNWDVNWFGNYE